MAKNNNISASLYRKAVRTIRDGWRRAGAPVTAAAAVATACLLLLASCHHIPLYDGESGVYLKVTFNPDRQTEEKIAAGKATLPSGIMVLFYSSETHTYITEDFLPANGGFIDVPVGTYDILVHSLGNESTLIRDNSREGSICAYTSTSGKSLTMTKSDIQGNPISNIQFPIANQPDYLYVGRAEQVYIPPKADISETLRIEIEVEPVVETWTFEAKNIEGAQNISKASCYVTGQIAEKYLWDLRHSDNICAYPFNANYYDSQRCIVGEFQTFGKHPQALSDIFLNILVQHAEGGMYQWIFNVTDQFTDPDNVEHKLIVTEKIVVPDAEAGGFTPSVNDWSSEITDIPL